MRTYQVSILQVQTAYTLRYGYVAVLRVHSGSSCSLQAKNWIRLFLSLEKDCEGFQRKNVTPYMHALVYHVPIMIEKFGNIKKFSGQGIQWHTLFKQAYHYLYMSNN